MNSKADMAKLVALLLSRTYKSRMKHIRHRRKIVKDHMLLKLTQYQEAQQELFQTFIMQLINIYQPIEVPPSINVNDWWSMDFPNISLEQFSSIFHVSVEFYHNMCNELKSDLQLRYDPNDCNDVDILVQKQIALSLYKLTTGDSFRNTAIRFEEDIPDIKKLFIDFMDVLTEKYGKTISNLSPDDCKSLAKKTTEKIGITDVLGSSLKKKISITSIKHLDFMSIIDADGKFCLIHLEREKITPYYYRKLKKLCFPENYETPTYFIITNDQVPDYDCFVQNNEHIDEDGQQLEIYIDHLLDIKENAWKQLLDRFKTLKDEHLNYPWGVIPYVLKTCVILYNLCIDSESKMNSKADMAKLVALLLSRTYKSRMKHIRHRRKIVKDHMLLKLTQYQEAQQELFQTFIMQLINIYQPIEVPPSINVNDWWSMDFPNISLEQFSSIFHVSVEFYHNMCNELKSDLQLRYDPNDCNDVDILVQKQIALSLYKLTTGDSFRNTAIRFEEDIPDIKKLFIDFMDVLTEKYGKTISNLSPDDCKSLAKKTTEKIGITDVLGSSLKKKISITSIKHLDFMSIIDADGKFCLIHLEREKITPYYYRKLKKLCFPENYETPTYFIITNDQVPDYDCFVQNNEHIDEDGQQLEIYIDHLLDIKENAWKQLLDRFKTLKDEHLNYPWGVIPYVLKTCVILYNLCIDSGDVYEESIITPD